MRKLCFVLLLSLGVLSAPCQSANEFYIRIYSTIQEADTLASNMQNAAALQKYREAQNALQTFQKGNPDWNANIVRYRLSYVAERIAEVQLKVPASQQVAEPAQKDAGSGDPLAGAASTAQEGQLNVLRDQLRLLQTERTRLEAKLKEALSARPAAIDPSELAKAEQKIRDLQKENELLQVSLEQAKARSGSAQARSAEGENLLQVLHDQSNRVATLQTEKRLLQEKLAASSKQPDARELAALRAENELLKKQVSESKLKQGAEPKTAEMQAKLAALQSDHELLLFEKKALQNKLAQSQAAVQKDQTAAAASTREESRRIKELEKERDALIKKLEAANKQLVAKTGKGRVRDLERDLSALKEKVEVLEAKAVPYSAEELALFNAPQNKLATSGPSSTDPATSKQSKFSASTASLAKEAEKHFVAGQYKEAEEKFLEVLKQDNTDVVTLANLAVVQLDLKNLESAEKHIKQALQLAPDDAFSLGVLGRLRWQQKRVDDALAALSHAAKLDPSNPEIQNYLGLVLSEKGLRQSAESALRKAIQLRPNYGSAHQNLAVIYVTQNPPLVELAKYHYAKSLAAGTPPNPELEKMLELKRSR